jgi:hypothetical protein
MGKNDISIVQQGMPLYPLLHTSRESEDSCHLFRPAKKLTFLLGWESAFRSAFCLEEVYGNRELLLLWQAA